MQKNKEFEAYLENKVKEKNDGRVKEAMTYSLMNGGKRIRPQLLFATLKGYGLDETNGYPAACAIEMIHTYSLIHDDLPAMDNDSLRRGKPTCHIAFDEATAILAGDGLLTRAFDCLLDSPVTSDAKVEMIHYLSDYSGVYGMVYGQELDLIAETMSDLTLEQIYKIDAYKTSKLLTLPLIFACILADQKKDIDTWIQFGNKLGIQFQILDDILDVTQKEEILGKSTSDITNDKKTMVSLMGLEAARNKVKELKNEMMELLHGMSMDASYLEEILDYLTIRSY